MSKITRFGLLAAIALTLPLTAGAQRGGVATGTAAPAAAPPARVSHVTTGTMPAHPHHVSPTAPVSVRGSGTPRSNGTNGSTTTSANSNPNVVVVNPDSFQDFTGQVPGLGFDFEHLAAISGNLAEKALIDPATQAELALAERLNRGVGEPAFFLGGYGGEAPVSYEAPEAQPQPAPQIIIVQPPATAPAGQANGQAAPRAEQEAAPAPLPDASDFLLVLKNGAMVSAVAFTRQGDQLVYVTKEGNRRTMSVSSIDSDATSKVNEARGTPLKLSI
ncbi:MAG: hypothetical protein WB995_04300 [Candidatus Acidiferrales bacterium]